MLYLVEAQSSAQHSIDLDQDRCTPHPLHSRPPTVSNNGSQLRIGKGILKVAAECGVGSGTVRCIKREMEEGRPLGASAPA